MRKDLKSAINQTKDVEGQIRAALQTPQKRNKLWIITESDYDSGVYERFFNDNVVVKPAFDENGDGGCARVVRIVRNILDSGETQRIIGIRDADYMYYVPGKFRYSDNIYHTDERDIEMMMLKAPSVIYALNAWMKKVQCGALVLVLVKFYLYGSRPEGVILPPLPNEKG